MTLNIYKNNTPTIPVSVTSAGVAFDLTGYTMKIIIKKTQTDSTPVAMKQATITTPATGEGSIVLTKEQTNIPVGEYWYEIRIFNVTTGDDQTVVMGKLNILQNLS